MRRLDSLFLERKIIELVEARLPSLARILKKLLAETEANLCARYINRWRKRVFLLYWSFGRDFGYKITYILGVCKVIGTDFIHKI